MGNKEIRPEFDDRDATDKTVEADDFNLESLRLRQDFVESSVKKLLTTVPVRRPNKQEFVKVKAGDENRIQVPVIELNEERELYLVAKEMREDLAGLMVPKLLLTTINRQGVVMLWPIGLPGPDGKWNDWHKSALEAALEAERTFIKLVSNRALGAYEVFCALDALPEPEWPDITFKELLRIAFRDRFIKDWDHPVLKRLQGRL